MKPKKNRVFCLACKKQKMLFETQSKADNFLNYNAKEILEENEKAPVRSYYCTFCCGWHVTSNPSVMQGERLDDRDRELANKLIREKSKNEELQAISKRVTEKLLEFDIELNLCNFDEAQDRLDLLGLETKDLRGSNLNIAKVNRIYGKLFTARERLEQKIKLFDLSKEEQNKWLSLSEPTKTEMEIIGIINRINSLKMVCSVFDNRHNLIVCNDSELVTEIINYCRKHIQACAIGNGARQARLRLNSKLDEILEERERINYNSTKQSTIEFSNEIKERVEPYN